VPNIDHIKLHIFQTNFASVSFDEHKKNVGRISFSVGEGKNAECYVFVLTRSHLMALEHQIQRLFGPVPPQRRREKVRRS
jgi:hypothetical protein